jgi:predicted GNAT family acetyltransferase
VSTIFDENSALSARIEEMTDYTDEVVDNTNQQRFLYTEDGVDAHLVYRVDGDRLILVHTEVPDILGGRGIGGRLVRAAVERAKASGETVLPWCPYARKWLQDHADATAGITIDWSDPPA